MFLKEETALQEHYSQEILGLTSVAYFLIFQILVSRGNKVGVSKKVTGIERTRLKGITKLLRPPGFTLTARTVAAGHSWEELQRDLDGLLSAWKGITEHAQSAALAAEEGVDGAVPVMLHRAKGQALSVVQDDFNEKVN
jgi:Ribonuclease G/E